MKRALAVMAVVLSLGLTLSLDAEARRLGGGKSSGMQRQSVTAPPQAPGGASPSSNIPGQAARPATAAAAGGAAAAAPKRSWMGPIAGLAAGLGIAALASHFGFGEALANMLTIALIAMAVMFVIGLVLRKRAQGPALAAAGGAQGAPAGQDMFRGMSPQGQGGSLIGSGIGGGLASAAGTSFGRIPAGFDVPAFERNAKEQFLALQTANDAGDLQALANYLTPEMLEAVRGEIAERGTQAQRTEVFGLQAQVQDVAEEADRYVVSVRFTGSVREQASATPEDLDETWHLTKPRHGGGWVVAGIQQS